MCQVRAFSPSPGCSNCVWPGAVTAVPSHGTSHSWTVMDPMEGLGRWLQEAPARGRTQRSGVLLRNRMSQAMPSQSHHRLHLLAAAEGGCWISHFPHCCEKIPSKKQLKKEMDALGSLFKGTANPRGKVMATAQRDERWCSQPSLLCIASRTSVHGVATQQPGAV